MTSQESASVIGTIGVLLGMICIPICWFYVAKGLRKRGWWLVLAHASAAILAANSMFAISVLFLDPGAFSIVFAGISAVPVYFSVRSKKVSEAPAQNEPSVVSPPVEQEEHQVHDAEPLIDSAIEEVRKQSIEAMKRATEARARDKQSRSEPEAESVVGWSPVHIAESAESPPDFYSVDVKSGETITFYYVNSKNEYAQRRVVVRSCTGKTLSGICLDRQQTRTFRLDRILGDVTSEETGEVFSPYALNVVKSRAQARRA